MYALGEQLLKIISSCKASVFTKCNVSGENFSIDGVIRKAFSSGKDSYSSISSCVILRPGNFAMNMQSNTKARAFNKASGSPSGICTSRTFGKRGFAVNKWYMFCRHCFVCSLNTPVSSSSSNVATLFIFSASTGVISSTRSLWISSSMACSCFQNASHLSG